MAKMAEGQERLSPEFQKRLAELIEEKGCSKREFAQQVGVSKDVIIRGTMYGIVPSLQSLIKIADSLNLPLDYLLGKSPTPQLTDDPMEQELAGYLEELRSRPEQRMLFSVTRKATREQVEAIVHMIEEMQKDG